MTAASLRLPFGSFPNRCLRVDNRYKYRLYFGTPEICRLRYDNERSKGDHRHLGAVEEPYTFTTVDRLLVDFRRDVAQWGIE